MPPSDITIPVNGDCQNVCTKTAAIRPPLKVKQQAKARPGGEMVRNELITGETVKLGV